MRLLVTRPQPAADRTAKRLESLGHSPLILPLFEARHVLNHANELLESPTSAIILTSVEAVRALEPVKDLISSLLALPIFAVGSATRAAAEQFGFKQVTTGTVGGKDLALKIISEAASNPDLLQNLLYLAGSPRSPDLENTLSDAGIACHTQVVYEMQPTPLSDIDLRRTIADFKPDAVLLYSAETARRFFTLATGNGDTDILQKARLLCLSRNIAAVVPQSLQERVEISIRPDEDSLMDLLSQA